MVTVFAASSAQQVNLCPVNTDIYIYQEYRNTETAFSGPMLLLVIYKQVLPNFIMQSQLHIVYIVSISQPGFDSEIYVNAVDRINIHGFQDRMSNQK